MQQVNLNAASSNDKMTRGNCESRNAGTWNRMQNGNKIQSAHDECVWHIVKTHMVIDATTKPICQQFSLQVQVQQPSLFVSLSV